MAARTLRVGVSFCPRGAFDRFFAAGPLLRSVYLFRTPGLSPSFFLNWVRDGDGADLQGSYKKLGVPSFFPSREEW